MCSERKEGCLWKLMNYQRYSLAKLKAVMDRFVSFSVPPAVIAVEWLHKPLCFTAHCVRTFSLLFSHADLSNRVSLSVPYKS